MLLLFCTSNVTEFAWAIARDELIDLLGSHRSLVVAKNQEKEIVL
jgi:hypothetical protein